MIGRSDRRKAPRHAATRPFARFGWWDGETFRHTKGRLRDLSSRGASLALDGPTPDGSRKVWLCVSGKSAQDWVEARVVRVVQGSNGEPEVRLAFENPCPNDLLRSAVWGAPVEVASDDAVIPPMRSLPVLRVATPSSKRRRMKRLKSPWWLSSNESPSEDMSEPGTEEVVSTPDAPNPSRHPIPEPSPEVPADPKATVEACTWAEIRADIQHRQRRKRWAWYVMLGLNVLFLIALALLYSERFEHLRVIQNLSQALNHRR